MTSENEWMVPDWMESLALQIDGTKEPLRIRSFSEFLYFTVALPTFPLIVLYLLMIQFSGVLTRTMAPFQMRKLLVVYNLLCSLINVTCFVLFFMGIYTKGEIYSRETNVPTRLAFRIYFYSKIIELLDTVFMILRHKRRQISFLHVFHHASMVLLCDFGVQNGCRISFCYPMGVNSFIHILMYAYYASAAAESSFISAKGASIKKRLTQLQLVQFYTDLVQLTYGIYLQEYCIYSIFYAFSMIILFTNFYIKTYANDKTKAQ